MNTTSNTEHQSPAGKSATERRDCRHWAIALLLAVILALMQGAALAVPAWLLAVPFLLLGWVAAEGDLMAGSGIQNRESTRAATVKAAAGSVLFHAVLAAVVIVAHGKVTERRGMGGAACGCGAKSGATFQVAGVSDGQAGSLPHSGCGCGAKKTAAVAAKPATPQVSDAELKARAAAIQKRTMTLPPSQLPGITVQGPDGRPPAILTPRPLPPGLIPKADAKMPKGIAPAASPASAPSPAPSAGPLPEPSAAPSTSPPAVPNPVPPVVPAPNSPQGSAAPAPSTVLPQSEKQGDNAPADG